MNVSRTFRFTAVLLAAALLSNCLAFAARKAIDPAAIKAKLQARGVGQGVRVTFADKTEAQGLIVSLSDNSFTLKPRKSEEVRQIDYAQITGVHNDHLSRGQKVGVAAAVIAGTIVVVVVVGYEVWKHSGKI